MFVQAQKPAKPSKRSKRAADASASQLRDEEEEELVQREPECVEAMLISEDIHPWLRFNRDWANYNEYSQNLYFVMRKSFELSRYVDWEPLDAVGLGGPIRELLVQHFSYRDALYHFRDWEKLFAIKVPVFKELCFEFHSTYVFKSNPASVNDKEFMRFRLGGEPRSISMKELAMCLGIYTPEELAHDCFDEFLSTGARVHETHRFIEGGFWETLSLKEYAPSGVSHKDMNDVNMRVIHRFIAHTLQNRRENREKITKADIWYLRQIKEGYHVNIPYGVASYLCFSSAGIKDRSPICGGHFITLIARSLGINFRGLTEVDAEQKKLGYLMYNATEAVAKDRNKKYIPFPVTPATEEQQQAPPQQHQQQHPQQFHPQEHQHEQEQPSLFSIMQGIQGMQVSHNEFRGEFNEFRGNFNTFRQDMNDWRQGVDYQLGNMAYESAWNQGNISWMAEQQGFQTTFAEPRFQWGTPESREYPPPVYNHQVALEEARRQQQEEYERNLRQEWQDRGEPPHWTAWPSEEEERKRQEDRSRYSGYWPF